MLCDGVVSELSSSGLLLSSVSLPLLPKLHPPLSFSLLDNIVFAAEYDDDDDFALGVVFFKLMLFFSFC